MNIGKALFGIIALVVLGVGGYFVYQNYLAPAPQSTEQAPTQPAPEETGRVSAEGEVVPARQVSLAFAGTGRIAEVLVEQGEAVRAGDILARLDDEPLQAALSQAEAALETARRNLQAVQTRLEAARFAARQAAAPGRATAWEEAAPDEFEQPTWYFEEDRRWTAAQSEVDSARTTLEVEKDNLQNVLDRASSADLLAAEARLADAQAGFLVAQDVFDQADEANDPELRDQAQSLLDSAQGELDAAQAAYEQVLDTQGAADVLEGRARLAVAQRRYDLAMERLDRLQTGERSLEVRQAADAVSLAEATVTEAEAAVRTAQVALEDAVLLAPRDGVVAQVEVEAGEVAVPGRQAILLIDLTAWKVETTDLTETDVVMLEPGMPATISLDAFPGRNFTGRIERIALVSQDTRGSVTYTVTLGFEPAGAPVRWGMTVFVEVELP